MNRAMKLLAEARPDDLALPAPRKSPPRRRWALALGPALAAVAIATYMGTPTATPPAQSPPPQTLTAQQFLLAAADISATQTQSPGAYWVTAEEQHHIYTIHGYTVRGKSYSEVWEPTRPGTMVDIGQWLGAEPATDTDRAAWVADGSPTAWNLTGGPDLQHGKVITMAARPRTVGRSTDDGMFSMPWGELTLDQVRALPADPAQLKALLLTGIPDAGPDLVFLGARSILTRAPVTPAVRAAVYRMLADESGLTVTENVKDAKGRTGTAVTADIANDPAPFQIRDIIDPRTGALLSIESQGSASLALTAEFRDGPPPIH